MTAGPDRAILESDGAPGPLVLRFRPCDSAIHIGMSTRRHTVLVVDDNVDAATALAQILDFEGYAVAIANDGRHALDYLKQHPRPDLIILDLMMPVMNGWELRKAMRQMPALADIPVVVMTALGDPQVIEADAIIRKPIDLERMLKIVSRLLDRGGSSDGPAPAY
jgi:CheY-like chemotaxis protein